MKTYTKPENLNGTELIAELTAASIKVDKVFDNGDGTISIDSDKDASEIVAQHNGSVDPVPPTIEDKLASVGLSLDDLKAALGL